MNPSNELNRFIGEAISAFSSDMPISAEIISDVVIRQIDREDVSPTLVKFGCVMELRQMARAHLRREYVDKKDDYQGELFEGLQERYPGSGGRKGQYLPRALMSIEDYEANINRLEHEAKAKQKHADALRAEMLERISNNEFAS